jgi:replicative DNA helicase
MARDLNVPANIDAERVVIGSVLLDNNIYDEIAPILLHDDFYKSYHQSIWAAVAAMRELGQPVDPTTLRECLVQRGTFDQLPGGDEYLAKCIEATPHAANGAAYAAIVQSKSTLRRTIEVSLQAQRRAFDPRAVADDVVEEFEQACYAIAERRMTTTVSQVRDCVDDVMLRHSTRHNHELLGLPTGFIDLDDCTCGLMPGSLVVVAGRPSMGKSSFALNIIESVSIACQRPSLLVSLEMDKMELTERLIVSRARVDSHKMRRGIAWDNEESARIAQANTEISRASIAIDDGTTSTVSKISALARRQSRRTGLSLLVVDYLQLMDGGDSSRNRQEVVAEFSRRLKNLARELSVPVIAVSQLNRANESREDHRPRMADLRESGAIEQDADVICLIHRPEYYDPNDKPGVAEINVAKNRQGPTGTLELNWMGKHYRFDNRADHIDDGSQPIPPPGAPF